MIGKTDKDLFVQSFTAIRSRLALAFLCTAALTTSPPVSGAASGSSALRGISLSVCDDENEWPPYTFYERVKGKRTQKIVGYSISVIDAIFSRHHISYSVRLLPWARCMAELKSGTPYQLALNMTHSAERNATYLLTRPYYTTTSHYFYSRRTYPGGLQLTELADLKRYSVCGLHGYNYTPYGLTQADVDLGAKTYPAAIGKLHAGRCSLYLEQYEAMLGFAVLGMPILKDPYLGHAPIPGIPPTAFRMGISRRFPQAEALRTLLDQELTQMEASGELKTIFEHLTD